jgi:hypothetical protein
LLERYFARPTTLDRIQGSWIGPAIETYVVSLAKHGYADSNVGRRVPILLRFGDFARQRGARTYEELVGYIDGFVDHFVQRHRPICRARDGECTARKDAQTPVEQMVRLVVPAFVSSGRRHRVLLPFQKQLPGFFEYLKAERGLRPLTLAHYGHHLVAFEAYLERIGLADLADLSAPPLSAFTVERSASGLARTSIRDMCGVLRVFLRYAHRTGAVPVDLSPAVEWPQAYRLSTVPRSIAWADVRKVLDGVDRRLATGKRDYAILLLLVTYGLRSREVAALTLEDLDWKHDRLLSARPATRRRFRFPRPSARH